MAPKQSDEEEAAVRATRYYNGFIEQIDRSLVQCTEITKRRIGLELAKATVLDWLTSQVSGFEGRAEGSNLDRRQTTQDRMIPSLSLPTANSDGTFDRGSADRPILSLDASQSARRAGLLGLYSKQRVNHHMTILRVILQLTMLALALFTEIYVPQDLRWLLALLWFLCQMCVTVAYFCRNPTSRLGWPRPLTSNSHLHQEQLNDHQACMTQLNAFRETFDSLLEREHKIMRREVVLRARQLDSCQSLLHVLVLQLTGVVLFTGLIYVPTVPDMGELLGKGLRKILVQVAEVWGGALP